MPPPSGSRLPTNDAIAGEVQALANTLGRSTVQVRTSGASCGAGVIWPTLGRIGGLIVTNAHVAIAPRLAVTLGDGREFVARTVARDPGRDLAALRIDASDLPSAPVRDAGELRPGELIVALGYPFGLAGALSLGVVHSVLRERAGPPRWVRADVTLAPGNSGGPLADASGAVVGINSMIVQGLGHAVPSELVDRFLDAVMSKAA